MADNFAWYRDALAGHPGPVHENEPMPGFYRVRYGKTEPWVPVGIWQEGEQIFAHRGDDSIEDFSAICALWTYACRNPVAYDVYARACRGEPWPDDIAEPKPRSNADEFTQLSEAIRDLIEAAEKELADANLVDDKAARDKAANYATKLTELKNAADEARKFEKTPHWEAGKAVDAKWRSTIETAESAAKLWKWRVGEALREIKAAAVALGVEVRTVAGTRGRSVSLRSRSRVVINDLVAAATYFSSLEPPPEEFLEGMAKAADRIVLAGNEVPGCSIIKEDTAA